MENGAQILSMIGKNGERRRNDNYEKIFHFLHGFVWGLFSQKFGGANDPNAFKGINLNNPYG